MLKFTIAAGLVLGLAYTSPIIAQESSTNPTGLYTGGNLGLDYFAENDDEEFDLGVSFGALVGYRWSDNWRTDIELAYSIAEGEDNIDYLVVASFAANAYYDFASSDEPFVPYIGGGLGYAYVLVDEENNNDDLEGDEFTARGEAGLSMNITPNFAIVPSYRLSFINNNDDATEEVIINHSVKVGVRLSF